MKDVLRMMHFDYVTAVSSILGSAWKMLPVLLVILLIELFLTPMAGYLGMFLVLVFFLPLQSADDKEQLGKLYGILPVNRKSIARGRFLFMFLSAFLMEAAMVFFAVLAVNLRLNELISFQNAEFMQMAAATYDTSSFLSFGTIVAIFAVLCVGFSYMEMMGQVFGREKEMKIVLITLGVITAIGFTLAIMSDHDMIPTMNFDKEYSMTECAVIAVTANVIVFALSVLFGEITAKITSKREL